MADLDSLLPHRPPMRLIGRMVRVDAHSAEAQAEISSANPFFVEGRGVPSWVGMEYMAQVTALIGGVRAGEGGAPAAGMLLGVREFRWMTPWFEEGWTLDVSARSLMADGALAVYAGEIRVGDRRVAQARINIHRGGRS